MVEMMVASLVESMVAMKFGNLADQRAAMMVEMMVASLIESMVVMKSSSHPYSQLLLLLMVVEMAAWMVLQWGLLMGRWRCLLTEKSTEFGTYYLHRTQHTGCSSRHSSDSPSW